GVFLAAKDTYFACHITEFDSITNKVTKNNGCMILICKDMSCLRYINLNLELFCLYLIGKQGYDIVNQWFDNDQCCWASNATHTATTPLEKIVQRLVLLYDLLIKLLDIFFGYIVVEYLITEHQYQ